MKDGLNPRRRPQKGGYARGDETRAQIIATALKIFGELGYDHASTREIATEAGVNPPALQYYFDGKEGLHRACAQFIVDRASVTFTPALERARLVISSGRTEHACAAIEGLVDALTDSVAEPSSESWRRFIHGGKNDGAGPGIEMIRDRLGGPMRQAIANLLALVTGGSASDDDIRLRALLILSQVHVVHLSRDYLVRIMGWRSVDSDKISLIKRLIRENTRAAVATAMVSAAQPLPKKGAKSSTVGQKRGARK
jgi:TetR/AcrR family transcriptional regulator, regulator of cefoperazone and chloramphenicol sensitivity